MRSAILLHAAARLAVADPNRSLPVGPPCSIRGPDYNALSCCPAYGGLGCMLAAAVDDLEVGGRSAEASRFASRQD
jgi:hypothetical protein